MRRFWKGGEPCVWLTGGALALCLLLVAGLVLLVLVNGLGLFWPSEVERIALADGRTILGQVTAREEIPGSLGQHRIQVRQGNRDLGGADFVWIPESEILRRDTPREAVVIERREWGNVYGLLAGDEWRALQEGLPAAQETWARIRAIEKDDIGAINRDQERVRLARRALDRRGVRDGEATAKLDAQQKALDAQYGAKTEELRNLRDGQKGSVKVLTAAKVSKEVPLSRVVRAYRPNALGVLSKIGVYFSRLWEFLSAEPREANTEGGVFPAIFGTVLMVVIMTFAVTPFGVLAAFYLREYSRQGKFVSIVRIAVNNLAGVPSIVFGVFGVGFFIYLVGGSIDRVFFPDSLPSPTFGTGGILWASLTLALMTVPVVIVATEEGLAAVPNGLREASLALGATRWETMYKVVLPSVAPSILTGLILAMARAAGEVAPLMITGVVKLAPSLPLDGQGPFLHLDRKFMHLGFHIYDVGFQSPNVDAARPMVYATTLLLLLIVVALNLGAILLRKRLRARLAGSAP